MKPAGQSTRQMQERHHNRRMLIALSILLVGVLFFLSLKLLGHVHNLIIIVGLLIGLLLLLKIVVSFLKLTGKK